MQPVNLIKKLNTVVFRNDEFDAAQRKKLCPVHTKKTALHEDGFQTEKEVRLKFLCNLFNEVRFDHITRIKVCEVVRTNSAFLTMTHFRRFVLETLK